ncbi:MAG: glycosyltransferase family 2 protein [Myxococcaceae bacterium]
MILLESAVLLLALPVVAACGYLLLLTLLSRQPPALPRGAPDLKFDLVVPAHNEEEGIAQTVANLSRVDWPGPHRRIVVVADNCTDATAERAREAGATVLVRNDPALRGKGYALKLAFERSLRDGFADAVVVVDADSLVSPNLLHAFAARLRQGAHAIQAHYGVSNPSASWRTRLMTVALALFNRVRSMGRERLGLSTGLRGNGMCFSREVLQRIPHEAFSLVEDVEYGIRLGQAGERVFFAWEADVLGEMVSSEKASRSQRRRWEGGRKELVRKWALPLLGQGTRKRSGLLLDLSLDLLVPPLSTVALGAVAVLLFGVGLSFYLGRISPSAWVGLACLGALVLHVMRGWWLSGVGMRGLLDLARAPVFIVWKLWLALSPAPEKKGEWVRTAREGQRPPE